MNKKELAVLGKQKAQAAVDFIQSLKHVKDPWHGCYFDLLPWEDKIVRDVFGTLKPEGSRQYKYIYLEIPKKQGKSELGAALALKHLCADGEFAAEVYGCAADKSQASIIFDVAVEMVEQEPELKLRCRIIESRKRIVYLPTKSFYQVLSAEAFTKHGLNVSAVIFDELHAQPNRGLWDVMTFGAGDARRQPIWWVITTAGDDPDRVSIGWEVHKKAEGILLGDKVDPSWYPVIYGIDPEENRVWSGWKHQTQEDIDWKDRKVWALVNPSLGETVKINKLEEACISAADNESEERLFRQLRLNQWVKTKSGKWISLDKWDATADLVVPDRLKGRRCFAGLDLSSKFDTSSYCILFPPLPPQELKARAIEEKAKKEDRELTDGEQIEVSRLLKGDPKWRVLWRIWIPEDNMRERVKRDKVKYDIWAKQGLIKTTPGNVIDYDFIKKEILDSRDLYDIHEIGFDPWNATQIALQLADEGLTMAEVRQGYKSMSPAMKEMEKLIAGLELAHGGNPVARWMFGNLETKMDENENIRPIKGKNIERIDGVVALINAMVRAILHEDKRSIYESRGMRSLL